MLKKIKEFLVFVMSSKSLLLSCIVCAWEVWYENKIHEKINLWNLSKDATVQLFRKRLIPVIFCVIIGNIFWSACIQSLAFEIFLECELPNYLLWVFLFSAYERLVVVCNDLV